MTSPRESYTASNDAARGTYTASDVATIPRISSTWPSIDRAQLNDLELFIAGRHPGLSARLRDDPVAQAKLLIYRYDFVLLVFRIAIVSLLLIGVFLFVSSRAFADDFELHIGAGGTVSLASDFQTKLLPLADVSVEAATADSDYAPRLLVNAAFTSLPGEAVAVEDATTWKAIEFRVGLAQPIWSALHFELYGAAGFATRLPGKGDPLERTARWAEGGIRFASSRGVLSIGVGADQRLTGEYRPAVLVTGWVTLKRVEEGDLKGAQLALVGSAILGIDAPAFGFGRSRDVVRVGLTVGR